MALAKKFSVARSDLGTLTGTSLTRGFNLNGQQVEMVWITKLTGDTTGSFDVSDFDTGAIRKIYACPTRDSGGTHRTTSAMVAATFTKTDYNTVALSSLGDWTEAVLFIVGRAGT